MGRPRFDIFPNVTEKLISCLFYGALLWFCGPVIKVPEEISKTLIPVPKFRVCNNSETTKLRQITE